MTRNVVKQLTRDAIQLQGKLLSLIFHCCNHFNVLLITLLLATQLIVNLQNIKVIRDFVSRRCLTRLKIFFVVAGD